MNTKNLATKAEKEDKLKFMRIGDDPISIREKALQIIGDSDEGSTFPAADNNDLLKGMSLNEFENGVLLSMCVADISKTFAIDFMRKMQKEYSCISVSEKATAELAAASYVRVLNVQRTLNGFLTKDVYGELTVKAIAVLSKELDRANRHYLSAIQTLRMFKQPPMQLNIKADTAVVGQNQVVQTNNETK